MIPILILAWRTMPSPQDYLIAEGSNDPLLTVSGVVQSDAKYYYSLDGVKWVDLQAINGETASRAGTIVSILVGDPTKVYEVSEVDPDQPPKAVEEEGAGGEDEGPKMLVFQIPELAVLRSRLDNINATCGVIPVVRGTQRRACVGVPSIYKTLQHVCTISFSMLRKPYKDQFFSLTSSGLRQ